MRTCTFNLYHIFPYLNEMDTKIEYWPGASGRKVWTWLATSPGHKLPGIESPPLPVHPTPPIPGEKDSKRVSIYP